VCDLAGPESGSNGNGKNHNGAPVSETLEMFRFAADMDEFTPTAKRMPIIDEAVRRFMAAGDEWFDPVGVLERQMVEVGLADPLQDLALRGLGRTITEGRRSAVEIAKRELS